MVWKNRDCISIRDFTKKDIETVLFTAEKMLKKNNEDLKGKVIATLFFEPSTRTRMSFQSAIARLGGQYIDLGELQSTSMAKGETLTDTLKMVDRYSDLIVMRHPLEGSVRYAAEVCKVPVINGGDGGNQHPTQTLIDLFSIKKAKGKIGGLTVTLCGDLKNARTMRSLLYTLGMFGCKINLVAPRGLEMDQSTVDEVMNLFATNINTSNNLGDHIADTDVLYVCRIQKERFADPYEAEKMQREFRITMDVLARAKKDMIILHPLPKVGEIAPEVDKTEFAYYFNQAGFGIPVRMAVLREVLG